MVPLTAPSPEVIRVLVADNTRMHTQLLDAAINQDPGLRVVVSVSNASDLLAAAEVYDFDVALVSSSLEQSQRRSPCHSRIAFVASRVSDCSSCSIQRAGRILSRPFAPALVAPSLAMNRWNCFASAFVWFIPVRSGPIATRWLISWRRLPPLRQCRHVDSKGMNLLSTREVDVVRNVAAGLTNREIAARLGLSQHTVKNYLFRIYDKLGVSSRVELLYMTLSQDSAPSNHGRKQPGNGHIRGAVDTHPHPDFSTSYSDLNQAGVETLRRSS